MQKQSTKASVCYPTLELPIFQLQTANSFAVEVFVKALQADVCVIGGGPAGSSLAAQLSALGNRVVLVERAKFPRSHLGESLTPGVRALLHSMGAGEVLQKSGALPVRSVQVNWEGGPRERIDPQGRGSLVDRGRFDALLLEHARAVGVHVMQPAAFRKCAECADGWQITVMRGVETILINARFLADASGRAFATRGRKRRTGARTTAYYAYWQGSNLPRQPRIEAGDDAWYWGVPIPDGTYNTLVFADPRTCTLDSVQQRIAQSSLLQGCRDIHLASPVRAADATAYLDEESVTYCSIRVGDAALAIDPLSSSGVQKAIQTALSGAVVVNTLLHRQESRGAALDFYRSCVTEASERHRRWANEYYAAATATRSGRFWQQRSSRYTPAAPLPAVNAATLSHQKVKLSLDLRFIELPCIDGEFVALKTALQHPALERPVTYVGGIDLPPLVRKLREGLKPMDIAFLWSDQVPVRTGLALTNWLVNNGLLIPERQAEARKGTPELTEIRV